jgi:two-component system response regulator CpxR
LIHGLSQKLSARSNKELTAPLQTLTFGDDNHILTLLDFVLMSSVLIIDDDQDLCDMVVRLLSREGYSVEQCTDSEGGLRAALSGNYDVVLLDIMMPRLDGLQFLRNLRAKSQVHVIMLTAKGEEIDRVVGLELGADDYLLKPFYSRELIARIRAVLRRSRTKEMRPADEIPVLELDDLSLDPTARTVTCSGVPIDVTTAEFDVLHMLLADAGKIVSRDRLARALGRNLGVFDRAIDMHISNLRKKLGQLPQNEERIRTVRNAGYLYAGPRAMRRLQELR